MGALNTGDERLKESIKLLNVVTLVTICFGLIYMVISLFINQLFFVSVLALNTFLVSIVFVLNKQGLYVTSRLYFLTLVNIGLFTNCYLFGKESGIHFFYMVSASVPFIFFRIKEFKLILATSLLSVIMFILVQTSLVHSHFSLSSEHLNLLYNSSVLSAFVWTTYNFYFIGKRNNRAMAVINQQNETISNTLKQKEILLQEVHHRVKNNLQIVISLLNLQESTVEDESARSKFRESGGRIRSISAVHELLYSTKDFSCISIKDYSENLIKNMVKTFSGPDLTIHYNMEVDDILISMENAVPLGLIINEIFTNSIKHSVVFNEVHLDLKISKKYDKITMEVSDKGNGFDFEEQLNKDKSIGLLLISELSDQIDGQLERKITSEGTKYILSFEE